MYIDKEIQIEGIHIEHKCEVFIEQVAIQFVDDDDNYDFNYNDDDDNSNNGDDGNVSSKVMDCMCRLLILWVVQGPRLWV